MDPRDIPLKSWAALHMKCTMKPTVPSPRCWIHRIGYRRTRGINLGMPMAVGAQRATPTLFRTDSQISALQATGRIGCSDNGPSFQCFRGVFQALETALPGDALQVEHIQATLKSLSMTWVDWLAKKEREKSFYCQRRRFPWPFGVDSSLIYGLSSAPMMAFLRDALMDFMPMRPLCHLISSLCRRMTRSPAKHDHFHEFDVEFCTAILLRCTMDPGVMQARQSTYGSNFSPCDFSSWAFRRVELQKPSALRRTSCGLALAMHKVDSMELSFGQTSMCPMVVSAIVSSTSNELTFRFYIETHAPCWFGLTLTLFILLFLLAMHRSRVFQWCAQLTGGRPCRLLPPWKLQMNSSLFSSMPMLIQDLVTSDMSWHTVSNRPPIQIFWEPFFVLKISVCLWQVHITKAELTPGSVQPACIPTALIMLHSIWEPYQLHFLQRADGLWPW